MSDILNWDIRSLDADNKEFIRQRNERIAAENAAYAKRKAEADARKARGPLTGAMLLARLMDLSAEDLELPVNMEGCDCYGMAFDLVIEDNEIRLERE